MIYVIDASALIALLRQEEGAEVVRQALREAGNSCYSHSLNLCEVFYDFHRAAGEEAALGAVDDLLGAGLLARVDMGRPFWQEAGRLKSAHRRVPLADCLCLALARRVGAELLTADHHEFDAIVASAPCAIRFIR